MKPPPSGDAPPARARLEGPRLWASFGYAWAGLVRTWQSQPNFRIECTIGGLALALAWWLEAGLVPVLVMSALVLSLEVVNSAIEAVVDLACPEFHPLAKVAKDAAAGATLLAAVFSVLVGLVVLGVPLWGKVRAAWDFLTSV
ncbi:diacylglycerol kinase family protein [Chloracidobacterium sp. D]|uniref:diacylglycerol kinase n=1 Tax=Chloracidobacterium sp. D TaxID=2821536 RepID=UPI001B8D1B92|nr:diacylglycerol kinase family protein [Chloracidobacterium sp. D]QUV80787.1 diacylglycerol kinase family protein [Chloracidobacterium sp. D]